MNEAEMVKAGFVILGTVNGAIYLAMTLFYSRIVENMKKDKETAIAKFFLQERTLKAFKMLIISGLFLVAVLVTESYGIITENTTIATLARITYPLPTLGLIYFSYTLQKVTGKNQASQEE